MPAPSSLTSNSAYAALERAKEACKIGLAIEGLTDEQSGTLERASVVCGVAEVKFRRTHSYLAPASAIETVLAAATRMCENAGAFESTRNAVHLGTIDQAGDEILNAIARFQSPENSEDMLPLIEAAGQYRTTMENAASSLQQRYELLSQGASTAADKLAELSSQMVDERARLSTLTSEFQQQFSTAQESRVRDAAVLRDSQVEAFRALLSEHEDVIRKEEKESEDSLRLNEERYHENAKELHANYEMAAENILGEIRGAHTEVRRLVGVIGDDGVRSGYVRTAEDQKLRMGEWQRLTLVSLGSLILLGCWQLKVISSPEANLAWPALAAKFFVALSIGIFAAYCATQAERAAAAERKNRKLALELEALGPFLSPLQKDEQDKFRAAVADRYFARAEATEGDADNPRHSATMLTKLYKDKELRALIVDVIKATKSP